MSKNEKSFAELYAELEEIVAWFEGEVADVDESLKKFERGAEIAQQLQAQLKQTENKVSKIKGKFELE